MLFARLASNIRLTTAAVLLGTLTLAGWAQEPPAAPVPQNTPETRPLPVLNYSKPVSHFPNPIGPYKPRHLAEPSLANTPAHRSSHARRQDLPFSQRRYCARAGEQSRYRHRPLQPEYRRYRRIARQSWRDHPGNSRGHGSEHARRRHGRYRCNSGASTGGTSLGAGGIGAGTNGLVSSTLGLGPVINSFDPVVTGTLQEDHFSQLATSIFQGVLRDRLVQNTGTVNFAYNQAFQWGTNLTVGFNNTRSTTNSFFST